MGDKPKTKYNVYNELYMFSNCEYIIYIYKYESLLTESNPGLITGNQIQIRILS